MLSSTTIYDHPGESILVRQGNREYRIVVRDDDGLGITNKERLVRLYEDDIEQARQYIPTQDILDTFLQSALADAYSCPVNLTS
jgi:hypothetical protein